MIGDRGVVSRYAALNAWGRETHIVQVLAEHRGSLRFCHCDDAFQSALQIATSLVSALRRSGPTETVTRQCGKCKRVVMCFEANGREPWPSPASCHNRRDSRHYHKSLVDKHRNRSAVISMVGRMWLHMQCLIQIFIVQFGLLTIVPRLAPLLFPNVA